MSKYRIVEVRGSKGQIFYYKAQKRVLFWWETLTEYTDTMYESPIITHNLEEILQVILDDKGSNKPSLIKTYIEVE